MYRPDDDGDVLLGSGTISATGPWAGEPTGADADAGAAGAAGAAVR